MDILTENYKLYNGDCLKIMDKLIEQGVEMDAIITDPPYGSTACKWDSVIPFDEMWKRLNKLIKKDGVILFFASQPFCSELIHSNINMFRHEWIWHKDKSGNFMNCKFEPMKVHEHIIVFGKQKGTYNPIMELREEKNKRKNKPRVNTSNILSTKVFETKESKGNSDYKYPTSIKFFNSVRRGFHPTQKPIELLEYLVRTYTNEGELILDFTMGSGSTGVACLNTDRKFIGIELDENYFDTAINRIFENYSNNK